MTGRRLPFVLFLLPSALLLAAVLGVPFVMNIGISLTKWPGVGEPEWVGFDNYAELLADVEFWASFRNNAVLVVAMSLIPTACGLIVSFAMFDVVARRFGARTANVLRACVYLPQILPAAVAGIVWGWILTAHGGTLNDFLATIGLGALRQDWLGDPDIALYAVAGILVWIQLGYPVIIFMAGLQRADPALQEAALLDGASWLRRLWSVTVPQLRPEIFVVLTTCTIFSLKMFDKIYVLTRGGPGGATNVPAYFAYQNFFEKTQVGYGAAISTVLTALILILALLFLRAQSKGDRA